jgi:hypothetical protein
VVVNYDLSGYAKNALKKYVPQLCGGSYNANELHDDHPVRFTNEGPRLDHKPENAREMATGFARYARKNPEQATDEQYQAAMLRRVAERVDSATAADG